jgi:glycerate 2-kinase
MARKSVKPTEFSEPLSPAEGQRNPRSEQAAARSIVQYALESVLPESALGRYVRKDDANNTLIVAGREYNLGRFKKIFVVGGGKAARRTGAELVKILGDRITAGILNVYRDQAKEPMSDRITLFAADHPTPNEEGVEGARKMIELLKSADERTLVIALISGGGSSLMALPVEGVRLDEYRTVIELLLTVPATIDEINAVRKHLDPLKGGGMRKYAERAGGFISLVLSDVPVTKTGVVDDPSVISSGPTVGDDSTFQMAKHVLTDYALWDKLPVTIRTFIEANLEKEDHETLSKDSPLLAEDKSQYVVIANNDQAMEAAKERAEQLGYTVNLIGCRTGTTDDKIKSEVTQEIEHIWKVITPHVTDNDHVTFASFSTDGIDGSSDVAGAIADANTLALAQSKGLDCRDALDRYDSATFFKNLGLAIAPGPTGTNVADVIVILITNPNNPYRKMAFVFGGEATVKIELPDGKKTGSGGRNTHLALLAAIKLAQRDKPKERCCGQTHGEDVRELLNS